MCITDSYIIIEFDFLCRHFARIWQNKSKELRENREFYVDLYVGAQNPALSELCYEPVFLSHFTSRKPMGNAGIILRRGQHFLL